jgi:DNA repair exonuclease SbcCD ATPase subunit
MKNRENYCNKKIKRKESRKWVSAVVIVLCVLFLMAQSADETLENLAARISEKRASVETLSSELSLMKNHYNEQLRSLATQQADIEIQIKRNELRIAQIERELESYREKILSSETALKNITPLAGRILLQLQEYISSSLPFQVPQRLSEVETLLRLLDDGHLDTGNILARIWNLVESEFRLTTESGLYRQVIDINGDSMLSEVARLGMVLLYYKTFNGKYGYAVNIGDEWHFIQARAVDEERQIDYLFNSLRKNLREGYFTLPNPYSYSKE